MDDLHEVVARLREMHDADLDIAHDGACIDAAFWLDSLARELQEARDERDRLRFLLWEVEYLAHEDCVDARCHACGDWNPQCVVCGRCKSCGHTLDCRLKAALEE